jgi:hypothetical protein
MLRGERIGAVAILWIAELTESCGLLHNHSAVPCC